MDKVRRGSVLMEFIVVLPVYLILLGFVFVTGEFSLQSIHLGAMAERTYAHTKDTGFAEVAKAASPEKELDERELQYRDDPELGDTSAKVSQYSKSRVSLLADKSVAGTWTESIAAKVVDEYTLTPVARGFIAFVYRDNKRKMEELEMEDTVATPSAIDEVMESGSHRTKMYSKDFHKKGSSTELDCRFGYYVIERTEASHKREGARPYRTWPAGGLAKDGADGIWNSKVYLDGYAGANYEALDARDSEDSGSDAPSSAEDKADYSRDGDLKDWSD